MKTLATCALLLLTTACATAQNEPSTPKVTNHEAKGNLQSPAPLGCVAIAELSNRNTPADITPAVRRCINAGDYVRAVELFAVAGAYGRFDKLRVPDETAHQAIAILQLSYFENLSQKQQDAFQGELKARFSDGSPPLLNFCKRIQRLGPPDYHPAYMLQHGMRAFTGDGGLKKDFDPKAAWASILDGYVHCPK